MRKLVGLSLLASTLLHGGLGLALFDYTGGTSLDAGLGEDLFLVQNGIAIESITSLGDERETTQAVDAVASERSVAQAALEEIKKPEEKPVETPAPKVAEETHPVIASKGPETDHAVEEAQASPTLPVPEPPRPQQVASVEQAQQLPAVDRQAASIARTGGDTTRFTKYLGSVRLALEKAKVNPGTRKRGTVVLKFTLLPTGRVLSRAVASSSGSKVLDDAAVAALDKAAQDFQPFPDGIGPEPRNVTVPFEYIVR